MMTDLKHICWTVTATMGLTAGLAPVASAQGQEQPAPPIRYQAVDGAAHEVLIEGSSTPQNWEATGQHVLGAIDVPGRWLESDGTLRLEPSEQGVQDVQAWILVQSLAGGRDGMTEKMHEALKAETYPYVRFELDEVVAASPSPDGSGESWQVRGDLTIAGVSQPTELSLNVNSEDGGHHLQVALSQTVDMTEHDVEPPSFFGFSVYDEVDVSIVWQLERQMPQPTLPEAEVSVEARQQVGELLEAYEQMGDALRESELESLTSAAEAARAAADELAQFDEPTTEAPLAAVDEALAGIEAEEALEPMRAHFADLSQALNELVAGIGHADETTWIAYRHAQANGLAGELWVQRYEPDADPVSPFSSESPIEAPEPVAIYPSPR